MYLHVLSNLSPNSSGSASEIPHGSSNFPSLPHAGSCYGTAASQHSHSLFVVNFSLGFPLGSVLPSKQRHQQISADPKARAFLTAPAFPWHRYLSPLQCLLPQLSPKLPQRVFLWMNGAGWAFWRLFQVGKSPSCLTEFLSAPLPEAPLKSNTQR